MSSAFYWSRKIQENMEYVREIKKQGQRIDLILDKSPDELPRFAVDYQLDLNTIRGGGQSERT